MKTLAEFLPSTNAASLPSQRPSTNSTSNQKDRNSQLAALIGQSFDIFNVYGKEPEALKNILQGFSLTLEHQDMQDINAAFRQWMREKRDMPKPSDILTLCLEWKRFRTSRYASPSVPTTNAPAGSSYRVNDYRPAQWGFKHFAEFTDEDLNLLRYHLHQLDAQKKTDYRFYLTDMCGFPKDWQ